jgi:hypothetical protein
MAQLEHTYDRIAMRYYLLVRRFGWPSARLPAARRGPPRTARARHRIPPDRPPPAPSPARTPAQRVAPAKSTSLDHAPPAHRSARKCNYSDIAVITQRNIFQP